MSHEAWDPVRAAVVTVHRGLLLPTMAACPDLPEVLRFLQAAYFYRLVHDQSRFKLVENYQSGRGQSTEDRARRLLHDFYAPFQQYVARQSVALNARGTASGQKLSLQVMDDLLRLAGLHLGVQERNRLLNRVEGTPASTDTWYEQLREAPGLEPAAARRGALFCFLGALMPVTVQRFQAVAGSALWYYELMLPPLEMQAFLETLEREVSLFLESRAVLWEEIPRGREEEHVLVELSGLGGVPTPISWTEPMPDWARLILGTVGGDVGVLIGNLDLALSVFQRTGIDAAYERLEHDRLPGELTYPFIARRYNVRGHNTITRWRREQGLEDEGSGPVNGGFAGMAAVKVQEILSIRHPSMLSRPRLMREMLERCKGRLADPEIVDMALRQLLREDRLVWTKRGRGEEFFGLRAPYIKMSADRLKSMNALLQGYLSDIPGLVRALVEGAPSTHVFSERRWIRRSDLDDYLETLRQIRERVREQFTRKYHEIPEEEWGAHGLEPCKTFLLSRVNPVSPK